jgi:hypothetical protein
MGQPGQFLDPDPGVPGQLNAGPCPERVLFLFGQVPPFPGAAVFGPDPRAGIFQGGARQRLAAGGELRAGRGGRCRRRPGRGAGELLLRGGDQAGQDGQAFAGPLVRA